MLIISIIFTYIHIRCLLCSIEMSSWSQDIDEFTRGRIEETNHGQPKTELGVQRDQSVMNSQSFIALSITCRCLQTFNYAAACGPRPLSFV